MSNAQPALPRSASPRRHSRRAPGALLLLAALAATALHPLAAPAAAQGAAPSNPRPLFSSRDVAIGSAVTIATLLLSTQDVRIAKAVSDSSLRANERLSGAAGIANRINETTLMAAAVLGYLSGRVTKSHTLTDVSFHMGEAVFIASAGSQLIRGPLGRSRPEVTDLEDQYDFHPFKGFREFDHRAFPSIHTSSAFAAATVLVREASRRGHKEWWIAPVAYSVAASPGLTRMYYAKHWATDVLMGAFIGTATGIKVVRYHHDRPGNRLDRIFLGVQVQPDENGGMRLGLTRRF